MKLDPKVFVEAAEYLKRLPSKGCCDALKFANASPHHHDLFTSYYKPIENREVRISALLDCALRCVYPLPEGEKFHNPVNLTPEQFGECFRPLLVSEVDGRFSGRAAFWTNMCWYTCESGKAVTISYRIPVSTPYPDGTFIKDGELWRAVPVTAPVAEKKEVPTVNKSAEAFAEAFVAAFKYKEDDKQWVAKFKPGDRVKVVASTYDPVAATKALIGKEAVVVYEAQRRVVVRFSNDTTWSYAQADLEHVVWTLSRHLPGFRPLRDGEEWCGGGDWIESDLPTGFRPLLTGEMPVAGDEVKFTEWKKQTKFQLTVPAAKDSAIQRTQRPLPEPEKKRIPLTHEDVPPFSAFRVAPNGWTLAIAVTNYGVVLGTNVHYTYKALQEHGAEILRPDTTEWAPCYKEE